MLIARTGWLVLASGAVWFGAAQPARASGPVERLLQVMVDPNDADRVVLRFGAAAEGFLFSEDGGHSFRATCTEAIAPDLARISRSGALYAAPALLDADGKLVVSTFDALWSDDGTGCTWTKQTGLDGKLLASVRRAPTGAELLAIATTSTGSGDSREARAELLRRDAAGAWSSIGLLKPHVAKQRAFGADLLAVASGSATRLYASLTVSVGAATAPQETRVVVSDDGGQNWRQGDVLPAEQSTLVLLAVDPGEPDRLLAVVARSDQPDALLLSDDQGKSFRAYGEVDEVSGVTFAPDGSVFVGDAGSGAGGSGGVWTAAKLGDALTRIAAPASDNPGIDCIGYDPRAAKLQVCKLDRFGLLDPSSGSFEELTRFEAVGAVVACSGRDMLAVCESQFNEGASWCCAGHFSFTPFCGEYDVTEQNGRPVSCGLSGRAADLAAGRGPTLADAGMPDAGVQSDDASAPPATDSAAPEPPADAGTKRRSSGGCQLGRRADVPRWTALFAAVCALLLVRSSGAARRSRGARTRGES